MKMMLATAWSVGVVVVKVGRMKERREGSDRASAISWVIWRAVAPWEKEGVLREVSMWRFCFCWVPGGELRKWDWRVEAWALV